MFKTFKSFLPAGFKTFLRIVKTTKNWLEVTAVKLGLTSKCRAVFRNGYTFELHKGKWTEFMSRVNLFREMPEAKIVDEKAIQFSFRGRTLMFYNGQWGVQIVTEAFKIEPYKRFVEECDIRGRVVVDIGANIGDTPVYFALYGAKKVYAFEPFPGWYALAKKNISENGFDSTCEIFLAGVGGAPGSFTDDSTFKNLFHTEDEESQKRLFKDFDRREKIPIVTLENIVSKYNIKNAFAKIDCEGFEYDIVLNAPDDVLRCFDYILIEYHYGFKDLKDKLIGAGFTVWHSEPEHTFERPTKDGRERYVGYLTARQS